MKHVLLKKKKLLWNKILCWWEGHVWSGEYPWHSPYLKRCLRCKKHEYKPPPVHPMCRCLNKGNK
jgi:hypothetical protein